MESEWEASPISSNAYCKTIIIKIVQDILQLNKIEKSRNRLKPIGNLAYDNDGISNHWEKKMNYSVNSGETTEQPSGKKLSWIHT